MIKLRKWLNSLSDDELLEFWVNKIIYNIGCSACPIDREECKKINADCDKTFIQWSNAEWEQNANT